MGVDSASCSSTSLQIRQREAPRGLRLDEAVSRVPEHRDPSLGPSWAGRGQHAGRCSDAVRTAWGLQSKRRRQREQQMSQGSEGRSARGGAWAGWVPAVGTQRPRPPGLPVSASGSHVVSVVSGVPCAEHTCSLSTSSAQRSPALEGRTCWQSGGPCCCAKYDLVYCSTALF